MSGHPMYGWSGTGVLSATISCVDYWWQRSLGAMDHLIGMRWAMSSPTLSLNVHSFANFRADGMCTELEAGGHGNN